MLFDSLILFFFLMIREAFEYILVEGKAVEVCKVKNESPPGMGIEGTSLLFSFLLRCWSGCSCDYECT